MFCIGEDTIMKKLFLLLFLFAGLVGHRPMERMPGIGEQ
jgi:hypothetical protein